MTLTRSAAAGRRADRRPATLRPGSATTLPARLALLVLAFAIGSLGLVGAAHAGSTGTQQATGPQDQQLTVTPAAGLSPDGESVQVTGTGFDEAKGIYVALCLVPETGEKPTPCGGGIDMSGESQTSAWISSNPPVYGEGLADPYGADGSFEVSVWAGAALPDGQDCREVSCAIVARADHLRASDRTQDVVVPVTFAAEAPPAENDDASPLLLVGAALAVVVLLGSIPLGVALRGRRVAADTPDSTTDGAP